MYKIILRIHYLLISLYRNIRDHLEKNQEFIKTPWGFYLSGHKDMALGFFEPTETKTVNKLISDVDIFVNVGANIGYYCCHALNMGKSIIAVEPNVNNLHYLLKNIEKNGWSKRAEIFPVALSYETCILKMWGSRTGASLIKGWAKIPENYVTQVPVLTLDRILGDSLRGKKSLILIDIEGAEFMMLKSAIKTISNSPHPIWMIEITSTQHQPVDSIINPYFLSTFELFFSHGYKSYMIGDDGREQEIKLDDLNKFLAGEISIDNHNFIFKT
jgi:FkbM family methyltransferase